MCLATVLVSATMVVTSAFFSSVTSSSGRVPPPSVFTAMVVLPLRSGNSTPFSASANRSSAFHVSNVACRVAAYGSSGALIVLGSCAVSRSCTSPPAWARKPTMITGASVVPIERTSDRVPSAEFDCLAGVSRNIR